MNFLHQIDEEAAYGEFEADDLADGLNSLFNREAEIPRIRHGKKKTLDTLISKESYLLARLLRNETQTWKPRIVQMT